MKPTPLFIHTMMKMFSKDKTTDKVVNVRVDPSIQLEINKKALKEYTDNFIQDNIVEFKKNNPQPFFPTQFVTPIYYGTGRLNNTIVFLPTAKYFIDNFKDNYKAFEKPISFLVKDCYVNSGWLEDKLDPSWNNDVAEILDSPNLTVLKNKFDYYTKRLISHKIVPVEWAVLIDWDFHKFRKVDSVDQDDYLKLKWGDFSANSVTLTSSEYAQKQALALNKYLELKEAQAGYDNALREIK